MGACQSCCLLTGWAIFFPNSTRISTLLQLTSQKRSDKWPVPSDIGELGYAYFHLRVSRLLIILWQNHSVQSLSRVRLFATPWITARQASLSITNSWSSLRLTSIELVMPSNHLIFCHPFSFCFQSVPASRSSLMSQLFVSHGQSIGSFSFSISASNEHPGLISFRMDWLDLLAVQVTSSKASIQITRASHTFENCSLLKNIS